MKRSTLSIALVMLFVLLSINFQAQGASYNKVDDLQEYITNLATSSPTRASDGYTDIDLSSFTATSRDQALSISGGLKLRFKNGTLQSKQGYYGHLLELKEQCDIILGENTFILPADKSSYVPEGQNPEDLIYLSDAAKLTVSDNSCVGYYEGGLCQYGYVHPDFKDGTTVMDGEKYSLYPLIGNFKNPDSYLKTMLTVNGVVAGKVTNRGYMEIYSYNVIFGVRTTEFVETSITLLDSGTYFFASDCETEDVIPTFFCYGQSANNDIEDLHLSSRLVSAARNYGYNIANFINGRGDWHFESGDYLKMPKFKKIGDDRTEWEFSANGNGLYVNEVKSYTGSDWLQEEIDRIASSDTKTGVIDVPNEYQVLDKHVYIPENTCVTLNGTLRMASLYDDVYVFEVKEGAVLNMGCLFIPDTNYSNYIFNMTGGEVNLLTGATIVDNFNLSSNSGYIFYDSSAKGSTIRIDGCKFSTSLGLYTSGSYALNSDNISRIKALKGNGKDQLIEYKTRDADGRVISLFSDSQMDQLSKVRKVSESSSIVNKTRIEINGGYIQYVYNSASFINNSDYNYSYSGKKVDLIINGGEIITNANALYNFINIGGELTMNGGKINGCPDNSRDIIYNLIKCETAKLNAGYITGDMFHIPANSVIESGFNLSGLSFLELDSWGELNSGVVKVSGDIIPARNFVFMYNKNFDILVSVGLTKPLSKNWSSSFSYISGEKPGVINDSKLIGGVDDYEMTKEDFDKINFYVTYDDMEVFYSENEHSAWIRNKKKVKDGDDLQDFINQLQKDGKNGTEDHPNIVQPGDDGLDVNKDVTVPDDLQLFIDGLKDNGLTDKDNVGKVSFTGGDLRLKPGSCVTFRNIFIDGCEGNHNIYVEGTLIIDVNVYIHYFKNRFIHLRPGGKVIIRGGHFRDCVNVIYNEGGEVEIEDGEYEPASGGMCFHNVYGTINIRGGKFNGGTGGCGVNETGGTVNVYGGVFYKWIVNYGKFIIYNGHFCGGHGQPHITNRGGQLYIHEGEFEDNGDIPGIDTDNEVIMCGCTVITRIYYRTGGLLRFFSNILLRIHIHVFANGADEIQLVSGYNYQLTQDDFDMIDWTLPDGYKVEFRPNQGIYLIKYSGVEEMTTENGISFDTPVFNLQGIAVGIWAEKDTFPAGIYIVKGRKVKL